MNTRPSHLPARRDDPVHVAILASAGTGKTFRLTSRVIGLLAAGVAPAGILATTFTRHAAGEILHRVLARLAAASLDPEAAAGLSQEVLPDGAPAITSTGWSDRLASVVRDIDRLNISTLDAFFARIAGGFALELGGAMNWQPAEEDALRQARDIAIARMLDSADRRAMLSLLRARSSGLIERSIRRELDWAIDAAHAAAAVTTPAAWDRLDPPPAPPPAAIHAAIEALEAADLPRNKSGSPNMRWATARERVVRWAREGKWDLLAADSLCTPVVRGSLIFAGVSYDREFAARVQALIDVAACVLIRALSERNRATYQLMQHYDSALWQAKSTLGVLAFDDVPRLLLEASLDDRLASMYYRLDSSISHVLLDEFQDTSVLQWNLIAPLVDEVVSGQGAPSLAAPTAARAPGAAPPPQRSFLCVGDVKQSLYGWRDAEPGLLPAIPRRWPQIDQQSLADNRRSSPVVIDAVNEIFGSIGSNPALRDSPHPSDAQAAESWGDGFQTHRAHKSMPGYAVLRTGLDAEKTQRRRALLDLAARRVAEIHRQMPEGSIGVLFRSKRHIPLLRHLLAQIGIPASEEGGNPLTDSPRVAEILSLLTLADLPADTAAAFHVAYSPLGPLVGLDPATDRQRGAVRAAARRVREQVQHRGLSRTLQLWTARLTPRCSPRDADRLQQLVELACEHERGIAGRAPRMLPFIAMVESRRVEDPSAAPVRLMSIHASKGLEFDAVVLVDLDSTIAVKAPGVLTRREQIDGPIVFASLCPRKAAVPLDPAISEAYAQWRERAVREELCALYVAMTRAVCWLEMIIEPRESRDLPLSHAGILRGALRPGPAAPDTVLWERGDPLAAIVAPAPRADTPVLTPPVSTRAKTTAPPEDHLWSSIDRHEADDEHRAPSASAAGHDPRMGLDWDARTRFIPVRSPSTLDRLDPPGDAAPITPRFSAAHQTSVDPVAAGIVVHAWLATIRWLDDPLPGDESFLTLLPRDVILPGAESRGLLARFRAALGRDPLRPALTRPAPGSGRCEVFRELPFVVRQKDSLLAGRFDRVAVQWAASTGDAAATSQSPSGVRIYDFKTSLSELHAPMVEPAHRYRQQLDAYSMAASILFGVPRDAVVAEVVQVCL
ncbi:MAG: UvrD-helicase domain-containing protein [Phycisphaerales bacterium]